MEADNKKLAVHDDSHARAILKGEMSLLREKYIKTNWICLNKYSKKKKNIKNLYKLMCSINDIGLSNSLVCKDVIYLNSKHEISNYLSLGWIPIEDENANFLKSERLYPICWNRIDSKDPAGFNLINPNNTMRVLFYFTEHALVRMMRRHYCYDVHSLVEIINQNLNPSLYSNQLNSFSDDDFIVITKDAYFPVTHNAAGEPIIKTWLSRECWNSKNQSKLNQLCKSLSEKNEVKFITKFEFENSLYISPF
ncbi:hypothetical protein [Shewanella gaetbuli]